MIDTLTEPVMPRWFVIPLLVWLALGRPEIPASMAVAQVAS